MEALTPPVRPGAILAAEFLEPSGLANNMRQIKLFQHSDALKELVSEHVAEFGGFSSEEPAEARDALCGPAD
jgi:hypothetical protein